MIDLGTSSTATTLGRATLSVDELDLLLDLLGIDELPVVLDWGPRFDTKPARDAAFERADESLRARGALGDGEVEEGLADRLRALARPHWVLALRLFVGDTISRLAIAKGESTSVLALRGPDSLILDDVGTSAVGNDIAGIIATALGPAQALDFGGLNAPTQQLGEIFDDTRDAAVTTRKLSAIGIPSRDSNTIATAMVHCFAHAEIVGVVYSDGSRDTADGHLAVFDTRGGRFLATASRAQDGTKWSALSPGTNARLRQAVNSLVASLPDRAEFAPQPA
ncbi:ESX secretion-associated protein EspG [Antrihabitans sp. NCIMB 15449]|uniref:ESX secretion-associated protein EspG n=1 Tax=Antrihabitans spumae TaxID=3373370 RepID=A0ABW7JSV0_9NOCA